MKNKQPTFITPFRLLFTCVIGFYVFCLLYRALFGILYACFAGLGILAHIFSGGNESVSAGVMAIAFIFKVPFNSAMGMYISGLIGIVLFLLLSFKQPFFKKKAFYIVATCICSLILWNDIYYGLSPISEYLYISTYNYKNLGVDHTTPLDAVSEISSRDQNVGSVIETGGFLEFEKKYQLTNKQGTTVRIDFYKGNPAVSADFSWHGNDDSPPYYHALEKYIGKEVLVLGTCGRDYLNVEVANIELLQEEDPGNR